MSFLNNIQSIYSTIQFVFLNYFDLLWIKNPEKINLLDLSTTKFIFINYYDLFFLEKSNLLSYNTSKFIFNNYYDLLNLKINNIFFNESLNNLNILYFFKKNQIWFPWYSFFNYITIFGIFYLLTLLAIYNTDNNYYTILYTIFLIFLFACTLVTLDLDIFAGFLLLIESVVILMLFFLVIYLTPNVQNNLKNNKWKLYLVIFMLYFLLSMFSYSTLNTNIYNPLSITAYFYEDYYEAINEFLVNDLMGVFINFYITDSLLLLLIGIILLIASIICVVLVSFFTKIRNVNFKNFLNMFTIFKNCYTFIFLRKQNLSKQGRNVHSTRIFTKKNFDSNLHAEYKKKQDVFEQQQKPIK